ncbi:MAG: TIGR04211 family SH3 domain-containing protein [Pseudomonadota bacterium]
MRHLVLLSLLVSASAAAETAYVTDQLRLGIHQASDTSDPAFRMLESGQEMEILQRSGNYAFVRLPDGTEGYVKAGFIVTDKPAALIVQEAQAETARLQALNEQLEASFAEPAATIRTLEGDVQQLQLALDNASDESEVLKSENERLVAREARYKYSVPYTWMAGAAVVCLLGGFLLGLWWFDHRSRQRHGGIRIY